MNAFIRLASAIVVLGLAACGSPAPKEQYFTLASPHPGVAPAGGETPSVYVGPVSVPEAVDRSEMVLSTAPNQVDVNEEYLWAEPLGRAIPRVVAEALGRDLGSSRVLASRAASGTPVDFRVAIEIQRFDSSLADGATIDALWTVTGMGDKRSRPGRTVAHEPSATREPAALAAAHSRALEHIARDIAAAIKSLGGGAQQH